MCKGKLPIPSCLGAWGEIWVETYFNDRTLYISGYEGMQINNPISSSFCFLIHSIKKHYLCNIQDSLNSPSHVPALTNVLLCQVRISFLYI